MKKCKYFLQTCVTSRT